MEELLKVSGELVRGQDYLHITYGFIIEKEYERLTIDFQYFPYLGETDDEFYKDEIRRSAASQLYITKEEDIEKLIESSMPLNNKLSIGIKGPKGWRGEDHKTIEKRTIVLGKENSTECFTNEINVQGLYEAVIHVFGVVSHKCNYSLVVKGE